MANFFLKLNGLTGWSKMYEHKIVPFLGGDV